LLGGQDWLASSSQPFSASRPPGRLVLGDPLGYQLALVAGFMLISSLLDLPWELWSTFRIEQAFGFNRTTLKLFAADLA
uniref:hypothetical protein n=1 Tax=Stenotrophomonas maltophilia TaxID=40324 RepID=UPI00195462A2